MNITAVLSKFKNISKFANYRYFSSCQSLEGKNSTSDLDQPFPIITDDSKDVHLDPNIHKRLLDSPNNFDTNSQQKLLKISILGKEISRKAYWEEIRSLCKLSCKNSWKCRFHMHAHRNWFILTKLKLQQKKLVNFSFEFIRWPRDLLKTWISASKIHWLYKIKSQQIWKCINKMKIDFQKEKQRSFMILVIFIGKNPGIEILNNGAVK